jgi:HEAT repeat protein
MSYRSSPEHQLIRLASDNTSIYQAARQWFLDQGPSITSILIGGLEDADLGSVAHSRILWLLQQFELPSTLPAVLKTFQRALDHKDFIALPAAMEALAAFKSEEALSALISVLQAGEIDDVTHAAALLGDWGGDRATKALIALLDHPDAGVRKSAVQSLLRINTAATQEALERQRIRETNPDVLALIDSRGQK